MAKTVNYIKVEKTLRQQGLRLFSPLELQRLLGISAVAAHFLVHRYSKREVFLKLRNGLYALADWPPSKFAVANRLYEPSYLSFEGALAYYGLIPETVYAVTSATTRPTRTLTPLDTSFEYHHLKPSVFTGYEPTKIENQTVLIATPEKAFVDDLYFVDLKKKTLNDRLSLRKISWRRVEFYVQLYDRPSLLKLARSLR